MKPPAFPLVGLTAALSVALAVANALAAPAAAAGHDTPDASPHASGASLAPLRRHTAPFHDLDAAVAAGYGPLFDLSGESCIASPGRGAMGVHYVNGALVGDGAIDPVRPEALLYEPTGDGRMRLVGVEYVVFQADWHADPSHVEPPRLFGHSFHATSADNRFGIPAYYALHVWLWKRNPAGRFEDWNPAVTCP